MEKDYFSSIGSFCFPFEGNAADVDLPENEKVPEKKDTPHKRKPKRGRPGKAKPVAKKEEQDQEEEQDKIGQKEEKVEQAAREKEPCNGKSNIGPQDSLDPPRHARCKHFFSS